MHAWLLTPDNFTPASRTPWGGRSIVSKYKHNLQLRSQEVVGESWEVSAGPEFPSVVEGTGQTLAMLASQDPLYVLGEECSRGSTSLLVKLLDAADHLSVQIHPSDHYAGLGNDECGKPESWYVLDAEPGAGIYLGLAEHTTHATMKQMLMEGGDVSLLLGFVPVQTGDFFVVEDGTPHAIGKGITLIEPQIVSPGRKGVTYRYWDWNRRYDTHGNASPTGEPRPLHVEHALAVTAWNRLRGDAFLREVRARVGSPRLNNPMRITPLCGTSNAMIQSQHLNVSRIDGTGEIHSPATGRLRALTVAEGFIEIHGEGTAVTVPRGRSAVIAARASVRLVGSKAHALLSSSCRLFSSKFKIYHHVIFSDQTLRP
jgi:mannose-6-phosphate isomerase class I